MSDIDRKTINDISIDDLDKLLAERRQRRLVSFHIYEEAVEVKKRATDVRLRAALTKQLVMLTKEFTRVDTMLDKLDKRINTINGLRLELEDYV